jgi:hypothetical protein
MDALPRLLAAVTPAEFPAVRRMLAGRAETVPAHSLHAAMQLGTGCQLVLCSLHFDDSRMFYLLGELRSAAVGIPVLCCCLSETHLAHDTLEGLNAAVRHLGALEFVDLRAQEAHATFAQLVMQQLR